MSIMSEYEVSKEIAPIDIPLEEIFVDSNFNCRGSFIMSDVAELANDIRDKGLLQPLIATPYDCDGYKFKLVAGFRRYAACKVLKRKFVPCVIKEHVSDLEARAINLIENIKRKDLNILQEANALKGMIEAGLRQQDMADYLGVTTGWIQPRIWLLDLPPEIQQEAAAGFINTTHIRDLHRLPLISDMKEAVKSIKEAKARGEKFAIRDKTQQKVKVATERKVRGITDLTKVQTAIREALGNGLATRLVAWAIGEITDAEMYKAIKEEADRKGINYTIPDEYKDTETLPV